MAQLFSNNADTTLAANINDSATALTVQTGDGALFQSPSGGDYELVTLSDTSGNYEIVKCTARSTDSLTVTRAQEGTTARSWTANSTYVKGFVTAGTLGTFPQGFNNSGDAKGADSVNLQPSRSVSTQVASGANAITVGVDTTASATDSIAIGNTAIASATGAIAIGETTTASGVGSMAIGPDAISRVDNSIVMSGAPMLRKSEALGNTHKFGTGARAVYITDEFDLLTLADDVATLTIPTNSRFYVDGASIIITALTGSVTVHPQVAVGIAAGGATMVSAVALANEALYSRQALTTLLTGGQTYLTVSVKTAGTGFTVLKGRVIFSGFLVEIQ